MHSPKIVVVGTGIAGLMAAETARKKKLNSKIILFGEEPFSYKRSALPSIIEGRIQVKDIMIYPLKSLFAKNIKINSNSLVIDLDSKNNLVKYVNHQNSTASEKYDELIISTGGQAIKPQIEGISSLGVFTLRNIHDAIQINRWAETSSTAAIIGAGFIGLLAAEALSRRGLKVTLIEKASRILWTTLEEDFSDTIHNIMIKHNIRVLTNTTIEGIIGNPRVRLIETSRGRLHSDIVIFTIGVKPRVKLAKLANITLGNLGIIVNEKMQTSVENIYAAGDCVEVTDLMTKKRVYLPLGNLASKEGIIAGSNAVGSLYKSKGFLRAQDEELFNQHIVSIGHTLLSAQLANIKAREININKHSSKSTSGSTHVHIKLIVNTHDLLIGAQLYASKADVLAKCYPIILIRFIKERIELSQILNYFKKPYRLLPEYLFWKYDLKKHAFQRAHKRTVIINSENHLH